MLFRWISESEMRALKRSAVPEVAVFAHERASRLLLKAESYRPTERITVGSNIAQTARDPFPENKWYLSIPVKGRLRLDGAGHRANNE